MRRKLLFILLLVLCALGLLVGCAVRMVNRVADDMLHALDGPARVEVTATVALPDAKVRLHGAGVLDDRGLLRAHYTVTAAGAGQRGEAVVDLRRLVVYLRQPSLTRGLPRGRHWVRLDVGRVLRRQGIDLQTLEFTEELGGGRRRFLRTTFPADGMPVTVEVALTPLAAPVRISRPPASQVEAAPAVAARKGARAGVRDAAAALEAYARHNHGYLGATPNALRRYDLTLDPDVRIVVATQSIYCVELTVGRATAHVGGPGGRALPGPC